MVAEGKEKHASDKWYQCGWMLAVSPRERQFRRRNTREQAARSKTGTWGPTHSADSEDSSHVPVSYVISSPRQNKTATLSACSNSILCNSSTAQSSSLGTESNQKSVVSSLVDNTSQQKGSVTTQESKAGPSKAVITPTLGANKVTSAECKDESKLDYSDSQLTTRSILEDERDSVDSSSHRSSVVFSKTVHDVMKQGFSQLGEESALRSTKIKDDGGVSIFSKGSSKAMSQKPVLVRNHRGMLVAVEFEKRKHKKRSNRVEETEEPQEEPVEIVIEGIVGELTTAPGQGSDQASSQELQQLQKATSSEVTPKIETLKETQTTSTNQQKPTTSSDATSVVSNQKSVQTKRSVQTKNSVQTKKSIQTKASVQTKKSVQSMKSILGKKSVQDKKSEQTKTSSDAISIATNQKPEQPVETRLKDTTKKQPNVEHQFVTISIDGEDCRYEIPKTHCLISKSEYDDLKSQKEVLAQMKQFFSN